MAKANNERTEREFQLDVNAAVANTETEIFDDALGDEPLDNDGDTSLEEMARAAGQCEVDIVGSGFSTNSGTPNGI